MNTIQQILWEAYIPRKKRVPLKWLFQKVSKHGFRSTQKATNKKSQKVISHIKEKYSPRLYDTVDNKHSEVERAWITISE